MTGSVLLVGPDGAGKSTVAEALRRALGDATISQAHLRPGVLLRRSGDGAPVTDPHAAPPRGIALSIVKLLVVLADTLVGWWVRWRPAARDGLLVIERGWYDHVVDPRRYRLPDRLAPLAAGLGRLVPRADLAVLLTGDADVLHARKREIGADAVARQTASWRSLAPRAARRVVEVDTVSLSPDAAAAEVLAALTGPPTRWYRVLPTPPRLSLRATGASPALDIYRPFSGPGHVAAPIARWLLRRGVALPTAEPAVLRGVDLRASARGDGRHLAGFRSSHEGRWVIGIADDHTLQAVVKIGPPDDNGLCREIDALERLRPPNGFHVPGVRSIERSDARLVLAMGALPPTIGTCDLDELADLCTRLVAGEFGVPVLHGDLAPWNVGKVTGGVAVWDWEKSQLGVEAPLHDLAHYVIQAGVLLRRWDPRRAAVLLVAPDGPGAGHLRDLGLDPAEAGPLLREFLSAASPATRRERVYRAAVHAAIPS